MEAVAHSLRAESVPQTARVLLVAPPAQGGLARHVIYLLASLHQEGFAVGVACAANSPIAEAARERALPHYPIAVDPGAKPSRAALAALQMAGAIANHQAQIVHTHSFGAGLIGALAVPLARSAQLVATIHSYPPRATGMRASRARHRWAMRQVIRRASRVITVSEALRTDLLALFPEIADKTSTIPNGIDVSALVKGEPGEVRAALGLPAEAPLVGMVARLAPQKGISEFIRACHLLARKWPDVHFVLAGDGPLKDTACALREELGLAQRLHLVGQVESARELVNALAMLVVASTSEGSSMVAMEAMAREKPVVGTRTGGVPEVVADGETGIIVEPGDPEALARGMEALLRDPERAREMGEHGRRRAAQLFDVSLMLDRTKEVYADLLRSKMGTGGVQP